MCDAWVGQKAGLEGRGREQKKEKQKKRTWKSWNNSGSKTGSCCFLSWEPLLVRCGVIRCACCRVWENCGSDVERCMYWNDRNQAVLKELKVSVVVPLWGSCAASLNLSASFWSRSGKNGVLKFQPDSPENDVCLCQATSLCFSFRKRTFLLFITNMIEKLNTVWQLLPWNGCDARGRWRLVFFWLTSPIFTEKIQIEKVQGS